MNIQNLKVEGLVNPVAIDRQKPTFSWLVVGGRQTAYKLDIWESESKENALLWTTDWVESDKCSYIPYDGPPLQYGMFLEWRISVRSTTEEGTVTSSERQTFSIGPCERSDWNGKFIGDPKPFRSEQNEDQPDARDREYTKEFVCDSVSRAVVFIASYGYHQLVVNGEEVDESVLSPSITYLPERVRYMAYNVQPLLGKGANTITVRTGHGWAAFKLFHLDHGPAFMLQMDVQDEAGNKHQLVSDATWSYSYADRRLLGFWEHSNYGGEFIDNATRIGDTFPAEVINIKSSPRISFDHVEPNRVMEHLVPVSINRWASNSYQYDFGRNLAGSIQFKVKGPKGCKLLIQYSDKAIETQTFRQFDVFICGGKEGETFKSRFNYHGFRWVLIHVFYGEVDIREMKACQIRNAYREIGSFGCSNPLFNQINELTLWTFKNLTLGGYVVDCPTRERLGYGDSFNGVRTALGFFDVENLYRKWLEDWRDLQDAKTGELPNTAPTIMGGGGPAWGSILIHLPWEIYQATGNRTVLEENFEAGLKFISFLDSKSENNILQRYGTYEWGFLGDWNAPRRGMWRGMRVEEDASHYFNNCYYYTNLDITSRMAEALGKPEIAQRLRKQATVVQQAVHQRFWNPALKTYPNGEQTYWALPLATGQAPQEIRGELLQGLLSEIEKDDYHLNTGHLGTYYLFESLRKNKLASVGEKILGKKTFPGFGYMLERGATTIWEQWDGDNSEIHSCYLSAAGWMQETLGGFRSETDFDQKRTLRIEPQITGSFSQVSAARTLPEGDASIQYQFDGRELIMNLTTPSVDEVVFDPAFLLDGTFKMVAGNISPASSGQSISAGEYTIKFERE